MIFRRPELEKDNPVAPEPYVGPRRRLAMARAAASSHLVEAPDMKEALQSLAEAASRLMKSLPKARRTATNLKALRAAIAQAERALTAEDHSRL